MPLCGPGIDIAVILTEKVNHDSAADRTGRGR